MFDCIVIGAGPAGATAAYHLGKAGRSVLLLDRDRLPRYKPCGGGVSLQIAQWFDFDFSPAISMKVRRLRYTWQLGDPVDAEADLAETLWMVRRDVFDFFLVKHAQRQGVELRDGTKATGLAFQDDRWQVSTSGEPVRGRYLIAADGAKGKIAQALGLKRKFSMAGALEAEPRLAEPPEAIVHLEFGLLKGGYAWNFPKADGYSLGTGVFRSQKRGKYDLRSPLADYAATFDIDASQTKQHGHPLLTWQGDMRLHAQNALIAGEAACVVDPFTAEGIRPAIFSGLNAARAIDRALGGDDNALEDYTRVMAQQWGTQMRWANRLARLFYAMPNVAYQVGVKQSGHTTTIAKLFSGERTYADVAQRAIARLLGR